MAILYITILYFLYFSTILAICPRVLANFFIKYLKITKFKSLIKDKNITFRLNFAILFNIPLIYIKKNIGTIGDFYRISILILYFLLIYFIITSETF